VHEAVSDILIDRARQADGLGRMLMVSSFVHAALLATLVLMPREWTLSSKPADPMPMMITLGGAPGPNAGGMTTISGRSVQAVAPPNAPKEDVRPAPRVPEMTAPNPLVKPAPKIPPKPIEKPADKSASRKPTTGVQVKEGAAVSNTGAAPIPFGGLTTGGGGDGQPMVDVPNFCCPQYLVIMKQFIVRNWNKDQGAAGIVQMKFVVQRDGTLTNIEVEKPSNIPMLDLESQRALLKTHQIQSLPREFTGNTLTVHLLFPYQR
jgi:outer membrane biosynthesis protein TonB